MEFIFNENNYVNGYNENGKFFIEIFRGYYNGKLGDLYISKDLNNDDSYYYLYNNIIITEHINSRTNKVIITKRKVKGYINKDKHFHEFTEDELILIDIKLRELIIKECTNNDN